MRKILFVSALFIYALSGLAQEKVMNVQKTDGTTAQTRVADLKQISFLAVDADNQGLRVTTSGGETVAVLFEANPVVTISSGKLTIKSSSADAVRLEIADIVEIQFGDVSDVTPIGELEGFSCVFQDGGVLFRGLPNDAKPRVYSIDGRSFPTPPFSNGELLLSRSTLGTGIYIVKVGTFSTKIQF